MHPWVDAVGWVPFQTSSYTDYYWLFLSPQPLQLLRRMLLRFDVTLWKCFMVFKTSLDFLWAWGRVDDDWIFQFLVNPSFKVPLICDHIQRVKLMVCWGLVYKTLHRLILELSLKITLDMGDCVWFIRSFFLNWINMPFAEENKVPSSLFETGQVAGSAKYQQSKTPDPLHANKSLVKSGRLLRDYDHFSCQSRVFRDRYCSPAEPNFVIKMDWKVWFNKCGSVDNSLPVKWNNVHATFFR